MCSVTYHESTSCGHHWVTLHSACEPSQNKANTNTATKKPGFNTCPTLLLSNHLLRTPNVRAYIVVSKNDNYDPCPRCAQKGDYDRNECRMVKDTVYSLSWGREAAGGEWSGEAGFPCVVL